VVAATVATAATAIAVKPEAREEREVVDKSRRRTCKARYQQPARRDSTIYAETDETSERWR
jgi:hypothetical protein